MADNRHRPRSVRGFAARRESRYWRSLEAVAETPEFQEYLHREFPENATEWIDPVGRRILPQVDERVARARRASARRARCSPRS